jgi:hypothetical protein
MVTIPTGFGQISVVHEGGGIVGEAMWTIGFDNNSSSTPQGVADDVKSLLISGSYDALISSSVDVTAVRVKLGPDATGPSADATNVLTGTVGGNAGPANFAGLVHKQTLLGGRQGRGRLYVPGLGEASLDAGGTVTNTWLTDAQAFFTLFGGAMTIGSRPLMVLHSDALAPTAIDSLVVDVLGATQRRRMRR